MWHFKKVFGPIVPFVLRCKVDDATYWICTENVQERISSNRKEPFIAGFRTWNWIDADPFFYMYESRYRVKGRSFVSTRGIYNIEFTLKSWCNPAMNWICLWCRQIIITTQSETLRNRKLKHVYSKRISRILVDWGSHHLNIAHTN